MVSKRLFFEREERCLLRKLFVFYHSVGAMSKAEEVNLSFESFQKIEETDYAQVRSQLIPMLRRSERFDFELAKREVLQFLVDFLSFDADENQFVLHFNRREYRPDILFGESDITERVASHPMALWKCRPKDY